MALKRVGSVSDLPPGTLLEFIDGESRYAICNSEGEFHALEGTCPHRGAPLGHGALHGTEIVCPWHAWAFDCRSGFFDFNSSIQLRKFPIAVQGDDVLADLP